jgi:hypothetical protein
VENQTTTPIPTPDQIIRTSSTSPGTGGGNGINPTPVVIKEKKSRRWLIILLIVAIILTAVAVFFVLKSKSTTPKASSASTSTTKPTTTNTPKASRSTSAPTTGIANALLKSSQASQGVAIGYVKTPQVSMQSNPFMGHASAATSSYNTTVFYDNTTSTGSQILGLNVDSKAVVQLTNDQSGASDPVFSSVSQKLAYAQGGCSAAIKDLGADTTTVIKAGNQSATCYKPSAWSPDGKYLAYVGETETTIPNLGLIDIGSLFLYDLDTNSTVAVATPSGFNSVGSYSDVYWQDSSDIAAHFVNYGQYASILKEEVVSINVTSEKATDLVTPTNVDFSSVQLVGNTMYVIDSSPKELLSGLETTASLQPVTGSDNAGSFLLKTGLDGSTVTDIYDIAGQVGQQGTFSINHVVPTGSSTTKLYSPDGFSAYMVGWGQSYNDIIYMDVVSNKTEIHQYDISNKADEILVGDLPLIQ